MILMLADIVLEDKPSSHCCFLALVFLPFLAGHYVLHCCQPVMCTKLAWALRSEGPPAFWQGHSDPGILFFCSYKRHSLRTVSAFPLRSGFIWWEQVYSANQGHVRHQIQQMLLLYGKQGTSLRTSRHPGAEKKFDRGGWINFGTNLGGEFQEK